jgi:hypothetical protein
MTTHACKNQLNPWDCIHTFWGGAPVTWSFCIRPHLRKTPPSVNITTPGRGFQSRTFENKPQALCNTAILSFSSMLPHVSKLSGKTVEKDSSREMGTGNGWLVPFCPLSASLGLCFLVGQMSGLSWLPQDSAFGIRRKWLWLMQSCVSLRSEAWEVEC